MKKSTEIFKIVGASVLSIGVLCAAFIAGNEVVFAHAASQTLSLPNITAELPPQENALPEDFRIFDLTVNEIDSPTRANVVIPERSDDTISPQEAAQLGAHYIYDIFGTDIDGSAVNMVYVFNLFGVRNHWQGSVANSQEQLNNHEYTFQFYIDTISGRRVSLRDFRSMVLSPERGASTSPSNLSYEELAAGFAEKHFDFTEVASVEFNFGVGGILQFTATDNFGREAIIEMATGTGNLIHIHSMHSDFIPGFTHPPLIPGIPANVIIESDNHAHPFAPPICVETVRRSWENMISCEDVEAVRNNPDDPRFDVWGFGRTR
jgi:hypothetical protein